MSSVLFWGVDPAPDDEPNARHRALVDRYMAMTLPGLYHAEKAEEDLRGIYGIFSRIDRLLISIRSLLRTLPNPDITEALFLDHLATVVGIDERVPWFRFLTDAGKRRIIGSAGQIWAEKGTGYKRLIRAVVGGKVWSGDWFGLRDVVGLAFPFLELGEPLGAEAPERRVFIHYANLDDTAEAVLDLVIDSVKQVRQRVYRQPVYFLDAFLEGLGFWDVSPVGGATLEEDGVMLVGDALVEVVARENIDASAWGPYLLHVRGRYYNGSTVTFRTYLDVLDEGFDLQIVTAAGVGTFTLYDSTAPGAPLATGTIPVLEGYVYGLRIEHYAVTNGTEVAAILDGTEVLRYTPGPGGASYTPGGFWVKTSAGSLTRSVLIEAVPNEV